MVVFTLGYEKKSIDDFIKIMQAEGITIVIDVREMPISRKKGFSKNKLKESLTDKGICYLHVKELGAPKVLRNRLSSDGDYLAFFEDYRCVLSKRMNVIHDLVELLDHEYGCLICYEENAVYCHRSQIIEFILRESTQTIRVEHL